MSKTKSNDECQVREYKDCLQSDKQFPQFRNQYYKIKLSVIFLFSYYPLNVSVGKFKQIIAETT